ncbi:MAG: 1-deoxy-D-xylulose-5-phosphate reductoisomerase, partial [Moorella sp. (in: Bacteria)]|nr:1-deoxy-D-xylulose-5-phosphate reductoisomerase [Moorella sp. (in: firmicutes)]
MTKRIVILGSTGSIGRQALAVIRQFPERFVVAGLAAGRNWRLLAEQVKEFRPAVVSVESKKEAQELSACLSFGERPEIFYGEAGLKEIACCPDAEVVLTAVPGILGLLPTVAAIRAGKNIAL